MPSPFPGMDPYLEAAGGWEDFHDSFLTYVRDVLLDALPAHYVVKIQERVTLVSLPTHEARQVVSEVGVSAMGDVRPAGGLATATVATVEPVTLEHDLEEMATETYLEIRRQPDRQLVTVIELLSPSNKELPGREVYLAKRNALLSQYVHLVEIDLLVRGRRLPMRAPLPAGDYFAFVSRAERRPSGDVYAWGVRHPLPLIPVPLLDPDPAYSLDLGAMFRLTYDRGRYERSIDYTADPPAFLRPEDRDWAREIARPARKEK
jgi:hypothetical protein